MKAMLAAACTARLCTAALWMRSLVFVQCSEPGGDAEHCQVPTASSAVVTKHVQVLNQARSA